MESLLEHREVRYIFLDKPRTPQMNAPAQITPRYGIDPYLDWVAKEGIPVVDDCFAVDLFTVKTDHWARFGVKGAAINLEGRGDYCSMFLMELAPGASSAPLHHLYEDVYYVLEGQGSTQVEMADGTRRSFRLVGEDEADPANGLVSWVAPLGKALTGKAVGDEIQVVGRTAEIVALMA